MFCFSLITESMFQLYFFFHSWSYHICQQPVSAQTIYLHVLYNWFIFFLASMYVNILMLSDNYLITYISSTESMCNNFIIYPFLCYSFIGGKHYITMVLNSILYISCTNIGWLFLFLLIFISVLIFNILVYMNRLPLQTLCHSLCVFFVFVFCIESKW